MTADLAIILVTDSFDAIAKTLERYRAATDPDRTELVVAAVAGARIAEAELGAAGFPHARVVDGGDGALQTAEWRAFQVVTAPLVVFAQAHAYPRPGYGAAVLAAWRSEGAAVIGPMVANANPETTASRVAMWFGFGRWMHDPPRGAASDVPGHNSALDRDALRGLGDDLRGLLEAGWQLQLALVAHGQRCFLEPAACIEIVNPSRPTALAAHFFRLGRLVASQRGRRWSAARRFAYAAGWPLVPPLRLARIVAETLRRGSPAPWSGLPLLALGLAASAAGEAVGYLFGPGPPSRFVRKA